MADTHGYYLYDLAAGDSDLSDNMINMAKKLGGYIIDQSIGNRIDLEG